MKYCSEEVFGALVDFDYAISVNPEEAIRGIEEYLPGLVRAIEDDDLDAIKDECGHISEWSSHVPD